LITYAFGGNATTDIYTLFGNGDGTYGAPTSNFTHNSVGAQAPANTVLFADFSGDDIGDIGVGFDDDGRAGELWIYFGNGDGTFSRIPILALDINPTDAREVGGGERLGRTSSGRTFDFDFDGNFDLIVGYNHTRYDAPGETRLYLGNGDGTFGPEYSVIGPVAARPHFFAIPQRLCPVFFLTGEE
jgi:hypothetical protein